MRTLLVVLQPPPAPWGKRLAPLSLLLLSACVIHVQEAQEEVPIDETFDQVVVELEAGAVDIGLSEVGEASMSQTLLWSGQEEPTVEVAVSDGVLYVYSTCERRPFWSFCSTDLDLLLPAGMPVEVWTGSGDVVISEMTSVDVETGAGAVELCSIAGDAWVSTGSGAVQAVAVEGSLDVETGSGAVDLLDIGGDLVAQTGAGQVTGAALAGERLFVETGAGSADLQADGPVVDAWLESGAGSLTLTVPAGSYRLDLETGAGDMDLRGVTDDPSAEGTLRVHTGAGDLAVIGL